MRSIVIAALLCLPPAAAFADQTVTYKGDDGRDLVLEIDDGGAVRVAGPTGEAAIITGGELFLIGEEKGESRVVRMNDLAAVFSEAIGPFFQQLFAKAGEQMAASKLDIAPAGAKSVNGFQGKVFTVKGLDDSKPDAAVTWVASEDPTLAPAGAALKQFIDLTLVMAAPFLGPGVDAMLADNRRLFALGTPIDAGGKFRLVSVKSGDVDDARFKLPAEPISRDALRAEMKPKEAPAE